MRRLKIAIASVLVVLMAPAACSSISDGRDDDPRLITPDGEVGGALPATGRDKYASMLIGPVCTSGPGVIRIVKVVPIHPVGGFTISDFSVVKHWVGKLGLSEKRLSDEEDYSGTDKVRSECRPEGSAVEALVVETYKPTLTSAQAEGFTIHYVSGDSEGTATITWHIRMCQESLDADTCTVP